jgi:hypothetical protein
VIAAAPGHTPPRFTDDELRQRLLERVEAAASLVLEWGAYVDTVEVILKYELTDSQMGKLRFLNIGRIERHDTFVHSYACRLEIQRPSQSVIFYLSKIAKDHILSRADIALDGITRSRDDAEAVLQFCFRHGTQRYRARRLLDVYEGLEGNTVYYSPPWRRRGIALYCDRPSKLNGASAAHIEFRFYGSDVCRALGLDSVDDLLDFNADPCIRRQLRLSDINWHRADRRLEKEAGWYMQNRRPSWWRSTDRDAFVSWQIDRIIKYVSNDYGTADWADRDEFPTQLCLDALPFAMGKCAIHLPLNHMIKSHICLVWP